jgi:acyl carrier protein
MLGLEPARCEVCLAESEPSPRAFPLRLARRQHHKGKTAMSHQYTESVIQTLALQLGVPAREILLTHDLYRDWGLTPLALVVVLLDLERAAAVELPCNELSSVRTVADLVTKFRAWVHQGDARNSELVQVRARGSRSSQNERRIRRELHHLRWLEHHAQTRLVRPLRSTQPGSGENAARRALSR